MLAKGIKVRKILDKNESCGRKARLSVFPHLRGRIAKALFFFKGPQAGAAKASKQA